MDCSWPGSSLHGDSPGKNTEWVAMPSSRGSSTPRVQTQVSLTAGGFFTEGAIRETQEYLYQRIFLTQESKRGLLHCRQILYQLSYK